MPIFKTRDGTEETVLFVTLPLVIPEWFRVALMGALREMTVEENWFVEGDASAAFARDKAVEMINGIQFSEENPLPVYTPPVGTIEMFASATIPSKWLACHGQSLLRADYAALFAVIGTLFGSVDGTHFTLPDFRSRFPVGGDPILANDGIGRTGGAATVTLTEAQIPPHTHTLFGFASGATTPVRNIGGPRSGSNTNLGQETGSTGGGESHENMPPFLQVEMIIYAGA